MTMVDIMENAWKALTAFIWAEFVSSECRSCKLTHGFIKA